MESIDPFKNYIQIGFIKKIFESNGEILISLNNEIKEFNHIAIEIDGSRIPFKIEYYSVNNFIIRTKLYLIDSPKEAEFIKSKFVFSSKENLKQSHITNVNIINYEVVDKRYGNLGKVVYTQWIVQQNILCVNYKNRELLIPMHIDFIRIDEETKTIYTDLPLNFIE